MGQRGAGPEPGRISGQIIINELIRNMELGQLEMGYSVLLPCIFSVYLHPEDLHRLAGVQQLVKEDAKRALNARVEEWNRVTAGFLSGVQAAQTVSNRTQRLVDRAFSRHGERGAARRRGDPFGTERHHAAGLSRREDDPDRARALGNRRPGCQRPRKRPAVRPRRYSPKSAIRTTRVPRPTSSRRTR